MGLEASSQMDCQNMTTPDLMDLIEKVGHLLFAFRHGCNACAITELFIYVFET